MTGWVVEWRWRSWGVFLPKHRSTAWFTLMGKLLVWNNLMIYTRNRGDTWTDITLIKYFLKVAVCWLKTIYCTVSISILPLVWIILITFILVKFTHTHRMPQQSNNRPALADVTTSNKLHYSRFLLGKQPNTPKGARYLCVGESFVNSLPWFEANIYSLFHSLFRLYIDYKCSDFWPSHNSLQQVTVKTPTGTEK